ncbi:radical SAM protein [bacterium]|nr:radical SAM protein [bacterium]
MFEKIFLDQEVTDFTTVNHIKEYFPEIELIPVSNKEEVLKYVDDKSMKDRIQSGKKLLYLNNYKGQFVKFCPAKSPECYLCCNLHTINLQSNCVFNCTYCILQSVLSNPVMQVHCNLDEVFTALTEYDKSIHEKTRICTGEIADSLALDHIFMQNKYLVEFFANSKNLYLELKTKSNNIKPLLELDPKGKTVVSFSLNPAEIVRKIELQTASLEDRLKAAREVLDHGYKVCFNIDPMIYFEGWQEAYTELFETISSQFKPGEIAWFHVGILRSNPGLAKIVRQRFPGHTIFDEEFVLGMDKKYRYPKPIRDEMYSLVYSKLDQFDVDLASYACVEKASHWKKHKQFVPRNVNEVSNYLTKRL